MEQVPKIVCERLKVPTPATANHPEADVLTAFSERSLPDLQRAIVLEHLARCGECREVLALSLPALEEVQIVAHPAPSSWFAWPAVRWGFVTAGVGLLASFAVLHYRKDTHSTVALKEATPTVLQDESRNKPASPASVPPSRDAESDTAPTKSLAKSLEETTAPVPQTSGEEFASRRTVTTPSKPAFHGAAPVFGPRGASQLQWNANTQQQNAFVYKSTPPPPAPAASPKQINTDLAKAARVPASADQIAEVTGQQTGQLISPGSNSDEYHGVAIENERLDQQAATSGQAESNLDRPASKGLGVTTKVPAASGAVLGTPAKLMVPNTRWNISTSGNLQRSIDQGKTWQDVNVSDNSAAAPAAMMLAVEARPKEIEKKDAAKNEVERSKSMSIVFRAVSANGANVWAGGSAGMLYHSTDAGAHWIRIIPSFGGATLTGEILTVAFPDTEHGRVSTSTSELWTTDDAGQTWQKQ
jgi:photosynthesis system II assembly factor YCF48-like protein